MFQIYSSIKMRRFFALSFVDYLQKDSNIFFFFFNVWRKHIKGAHVFSPEICLYTIRHNKIVKAHNEAVDNGRWGSILCYHMSSRLVLVKLLSSNEERQSQEREKKSDSLGIRCNIHKLWPDKVRALRVTAHHGTRRVPITGGFRIEITY